MLLLNQNLSLRASLWIIALWGCLLSDIGLWLSTADCAGMKLITFKPGRCLLNSITSWELLNLSASIFLSVKPGKIVGPTLKDFVEISIFIIKIIIAICHSSILYSSMILRRQGILYKGTRQQERCTKNARCPNLVSVWPAWWP